ncbi:MAG TPA: GDP-mannose 4,6-dehydratase, partial [Polyangiaceae bacterium]
ASKAASDHLVRAYARTYGVKATLSHSSNNYGPCQFPEKLIPLMILNMLEGKSLPIYGTGTNVRDWVFVEDHAEAIWMILGRGASGQTYDIGGEEERTNLEVVSSLVDAVSALAGIPEASLRKLITFVEDRPGHDLRYAIDCTKLRSQLGWKPQHDFDRGIRETVKWYLDNPQWIAGVRTGAYREWMKTNYASRGPGRR